MFLKPSYSFILEQLGVHLCFCLCMSCTGALGSQNTRSSGAREKAQRLNAHFSCLEALGVGPGTHKVARYFNSRSRGPDSL